ncbi:MAG: methionyl-tRNA formyltransferase [bacterium]|nr:methionyl-tRNA formyltransferase [bacterium]
MENSKMKIIFIGTPEFGAIVLEELIRGGYPPILVISSPDKPVGREHNITPPPVKVLAEKHGIKIIQPEQIQSSKSKIQNLETDLIVVAAYGQIIPKEILDIPKRGSLNVHPSLLPKYRGSSPIQFTILNGEKKSGVTIILMDEKIDHGKIISNFQFQISNEEITYPELLKELAKLGAKLLLETIPKWARGEIEPKPQNEAKAIYTKILTKEDGKIDWQKSAEELERKIRAFYPWPGSHTIWQDKGKLIKIKILKTRTFKSPDKVKYPVGKVLVVPQNEIGVRCGKDFLIIEKLQMEGGKEMASEDFLRGHPDLIGTILK